MVASSQTSEFQAGLERHPKHEEVAVVAFGHWEDRKDFGILGDALSDWFWAENLLGHAEPIGK